MDCKTARQHLSAYLDGELDSATSQLLSGHLEECSICERRFAGEEKADHMMASALGKCSTPDALWSSIRSDVKRDALTRGSTSHGWRIGGFLAIAAALVIAVWGFWPDSQTSKSYQDFWNTESLASVVNSTAGDTAMLSDEEISRALEKEYGLAMVTKRESLSGHPLKVEFAELVDFAGVPAMRVHVKCCGKPATVTVFRRSEAEKLPTEIRTVLDQSRNQDTMHGTFHVGVEEVGDYESVIFSEHYLKGLRKVIVASET